MVPFGLGKIDVPDSWETRSQITLLETESGQLPTPTPPTMNQWASKPRANFVITRQLSDDSATDALAEFLKHSAEGVPGLKIHAKDEVDFLDGGSGSSVTISFNGTPQIRLVQRHVFRKDDGVLTQIVLTVDCTRLDELDTLLFDVLRTFSPAT